MSVCPYVHLKGFSGNVSNYANSLTARLRAERPTGIVGAFEVTAVGENHVDIDADQVMRLAASPLTAKMIVLLITRLAPPAV